MGFETVDGYLATLEGAISRLGLKSRRERIDTSAQGRPITAYALDNLPRKLLVLGFPHPNEPLSQVVVRRMLERAAELAGTGNDTWWLVPVWDIDGACMNEGWWQGELTLSRAARGWFRPATKYQVEWDFPLAYGGYEHEMSLPETMAVSRLIGRVDPDGLFSLHNGTVGGAHALVGGPGEGFARAVSETLAASGLAIFPHVPAPYCERLADGVFTLPYAHREIDFLKGAGDFGPDYASGSASFEQVGGGCHSLVLELPMFSLDTRLIPGTPATLGTSLGILWSRFEEDLVSIFPCDLDDMRSDLLLSSPREFWERRASDGAYVRSIAKQMGEWPHGEAAEQYLALLFSIATQYSQLSRALGHDAGGGSLCFSALERVAEAATPINLSAVEDITDGLVQAFVEA